MRTIIHYRTRFVCNEIELLIILHWQIWRFQLDFKSQLAFWHINLMLWIVLVNWTDDQVWWFECLAIYLPKNCERYRYRSNNSKTAAMVFFLCFFIHSWIPILRSDFNFILLTHANAICWLFPNISCTTIQYIWTISLINEPINLAKKVYHRITKHR